MTPKKEKCGLGAYAPKNPAEKGMSCTFFSFEFLHTQKLERFVLGGHPTRLWFQSCDVLGGKLKTRRPKSAFGGILFSD